MSNTGSQHETRRIVPTMWACGAASQVVGAMVIHKRGDGGPSMPLRAFSIASLILGAGVCFVGGALHVTGIREFTPAQLFGIFYGLTTKALDLVTARIYKVNDLVSIGRKIRLALGKPPRTHS